MMDNNIPQYPMMFDPSQWSNKYSAFNTGTQMPGWPTQYSGVPTDAHGNPIQSYLNAQAANAAAPPQQAAPVTLNSNPSLQQGYNQAMLNATLPGGPDQMGARQKANILSQAINNPNSAWGQWAQNMGYNVNGLGQQGQGAATGGGGGGRIDMNQAYLNALSNPGHVTTPGATVAQSPTPSGQSNVLQQFLANWKPQQGAGNYSNAGVFNALKGNV